MMLEDVAAIERTIECPRREMRATLDRGKLARLRDELKAELTKLPRSTEGRG